MQHRKRRHPARHEARQTSSRRNLADRATIFDYWLRQGDWIDPHTSLSFTQLVHTTDAIDGVPPGTRIYMCFACGRGNTVRAHIQARSVGGSDDADNLHLLCPGCHQESELLDRQAYWFWIRSKIRIRPEDITAQLLGHDTIQDAWIQHQDTFVHHLDTLYTTGWPPKLIQLSLALESMYPDPYTRMRAAFIRHAYLHVHTIRQQSAQVSTYPNTHPSISRPSRAWIQYLGEYGEDIYLHAMEYGIPHACILAIEEGFPAPPGYRHISKRSISMVVHQYDQHHIQRR